jgi:hypothetical protein
MRTLTTVEIEQVSGGGFEFLAGYLASKLLDAYFAYWQDPEPLFMDTDATLQYGNSFGMY